MGLYLLHIGVTVGVLLFALFVASVGYVGVTREFKHYPLAKFVITPFCIGVILIASWCAVSFCSTQQQNYESQVIQEWKNN